ncbi:hypothetical protein E5288_WYG009487 [Bos mutus]|uniref:Uncharacterized protein n=1 Tax=Bos mutus TaxID=72004 RepID=A0A6B0RTM3_9CETA|nr:hypothetical protein [Bos mutus]
MEPELFDLVFGVRSGTKGGAGGGLEEDVGPCARARVQDGEAQLLYLSSQKKAERCENISTGVGGDSWHRRGLIDEKPNGYTDRTPDTAFCILFQMRAVVRSLVTVQGIVLTSSAISFDRHKKGPEEGLSCDLLGGAVLDVKQWGERAVSTAVRLSQRAVFQALKHTLTAALGPCVVDPVLLVSPRPRQLPHRLLLASLVLLCSLQAVSVADVSSRVGVDGICWLPATLSRLQLLDLVLPCQCSGLLVQKHPSSAVLRSQRLVSGSASPWRLLVLFGELSLAHMFAACLHFPVALLVGIASPLPPWSDSGTRRCSVTVRMNSDSLLDSSPSWALAVLSGGLGLPQTLAGQRRLSDGLQLESEKPTA